MSDFGSQPTNTAIDIVSLKVGDEVNKVSLVISEIQKIRDSIAKRNRQIIVITHNANIPVNGDAEYITSMDSGSVFVKKKYEGTLDQESGRGCLYHTSSRKPIMHTE